MFAGHYGVSLAAKAAAPRVPLAALFVAVQLLDFLFFSFLLVGVEKMRIVPGFTAYNAYDLYFMPYSHSLAGALAWSALAGLAWLAVRRSPSEALVVGLAVVSHLVCDWPVHTADLPLYPGAASPKIGLGLWDFVPGALAMELFTLASGWLLFARRARSLASARPMRALAVVLTLVALATPFLPAPRTTTEIALQGLAAYVAFAFAARWAERRAARVTPAP